MKRTFLISIILGQIISGYAAGSAQAAMGADMLRTPVLPRAIAMGGAYLGMAEDINCMLFNPAGLAQIEKTQLAFIHNVGLVDSREYFAFGKPLKAGGTIGGSIQYRNLPAIDNPGAVDENGNKDEAVNSQDMYIGLSYGFGLKTDSTNKANDLGLGVNMKWLRSVLGNFEASSIAVDLGANWHPVTLPELQLGLALQNLGSALKYDAEEDALPLNLGVGANYRVYQDSLNDCKLLLDINYPIDAAFMRINVGTEYWFNQVIAVRLGYQYENDSVASGIQAGLGFNFPMGSTVLQVDYAYKPMQLSSAMNDAEHYISVLIGF